MIDTFSANSLKVLENSVLEFERKYILKNELISADSNRSTGNKLHSLINFYLKGFDIEKMEKSLDKAEFEIWQKAKNSEIIKQALNLEEFFTEKPFFIKETNGKGGAFYLTGRFDLVFISNGKVTIADWKTKTLPKDPENDIQTVVYTHAASKLFKTKNIEMVYYSLLKQETIKAGFKDGGIERIKKIVEKAKDRPSL